MAENFGMRAVLENTAYIGDLESTFRSLGAKKIRRLVYLLVSAETTPDPHQYTLNEIPGLMRVSRALVDIPINRYSTDTAELMRQAVAQWQRELRQRPPGTDSIFAPDADVYFINASLTEIADPDEQARLMNIPTNLALTDDELDHLLLAATKLLRNDKEYQRLLHDLATDAATPSPTK